MANGQGSGGVTNGSPAGDALGWLAAGGPVLQILLGISVLALAVALLKLFQFARLRVWSTRVLNQALSHWQNDRTEEALTLLRGSPNPAASVLLAAISNYSRNPQDEPRIREEVERLATEWLERLRRYFRVLEVIGALSPLLGLLGTVFGMIEAFRQVEAAGGQLSPSLLAGGIWEALLTTAGGLTVAIPTVAALNALEHLVERLRHRMEDAVTLVFTRDLARETAGQVV